MEKSLKNLVKDFDDNRPLYQSNEAQTRISLINPLLQLLGWDITDPQVVRVEPPVQTLSGKKKADYILYDDRGRPVVVIEAKAPKVNIARDTDAIFQLLRYGRNLDTVPVGILTDFEEWEVYNTSMDPTKDTQRVRIPDLCMRYTDYAKEWDRLEAHFSRPAVLEGKLRAFVTTTKTTLPLGEKFLKDLERYRKLIAQALVKGNRFAHDWDLNEATQRVLDRLLLLRILEDRGYGDRGGWLHRIATADDPGRHLSDLVSRLQTTYNSRFFEHHPVDDLRLEPGKLRKVVKELADPDSVYDFSAMPVEIIGKAYEQFLGSVIRTTPKQVRIEPKPEVRKAGGVYYTPRYIVDYIVENTLGPLFEGGSLSQAVKIKILDPACGSGSFLIGAARWLERWYSKKYGRPTTYEERQTIVLRHLHGVDIDSNAVEVTQLSLCLWLLEEAPFQLKMLHQALLPDLSGNIRCGNSLIGSDFYTGDQYDLFDDAEVQHRVNAFDWDGPRGWPEIMKRGGFDAVIGNPPYAYRVATDDTLRPYYVNKYKSAEGNYELYKFFIERALNLVSTNGIIGFITSATFLVQPSFKKLREFILNTAEMKKLAPLGPKVFLKATVDTAIIVAERKTSAPNHRIIVQAPEKPTDLPITCEYTIRQNRFKTNINCTFDYRLSDEGYKLVEGVLEKFPTIEKDYEFGVGINTGYIRDELVAETKLNESYHPMVPGSGISRYGQILTKGWIMYDKEYVRSRRELGRSLPPKRFFESEKILVVRTRNLSLERRLIATLDKNKTYNLNRLSNIIAKSGYNLKGLLGILNSSFFNWLYSTRYFDYEIKPVYLKKSPLADTNNKMLIKLVERMLNLHKKLPDAAGSDKAQIEQLIERTDHEIDRLVYELYDLTDDEIAIVEEAVSR